MKYPAWLSALRIGRKRLIKLLIVVLAVLCLGWMALPLVPLPGRLLQAPPSSVDFFDREGRPLRLTPAVGGQFSGPVPFGAVPSQLIDATLAAEDQRFWDHGGVDLRAVVRAFGGLVRHRRVVSGGSTITQQLIKLCEPRPRTLRTKVIEWVQAMRLEQVWGKEEILENYLNRLSYGNRCLGPRRAAEFYFAKPLSDLSTAEAAFLAGLPQAPGRLNPHRNFEAALRRQQWILERMMQTGRIDGDEWNRARVEPLRLASPVRAFNAPHFVDFLMRAPGLPESGVVRTTLDLDLNGFVVETLRDAVGRLGSRHVMNGAALVLDNRTGEILAMVGSDDYFDRAAGQVNGCLALRSPGSSLKPFTYLLALERGRTLSSLVADVPVEFATPTGVFSPVNYDRRYHGPIRYRPALGNSLNVCAVRVLEEAGGAAALMNLLASAGITSLDRPAEHYGLGLTLGNAEVSLLELANAYATLARLGTVLPHRSLLLPPRAPEPAVAALCRPSSAWLIAQALSDNDARSIAFGLDSHLRFDFPVACKTGTSSDFRDNWAVGYTPEFTVGVWVGNFDGSPMAKVSGVTGAAPVLNRILTHLHEERGTGWYERPADVVELAVHRITGRQVSPDDPDAVREWFSADALPERMTEEDFDSLGRLRLPAEYRAWLAGGDHSLGGRVVTDDPAAEPLRILSPLPGTVYYLDPDLPGRGSRISLEVADPIGVAWTSPSLRCGRDEHGAHALLEEGSHRLSVLREATGETCETWITVKRL